MLTLPVITVAIQFSPFPFPEEYKCTSFLTNQISDETLEYFYSVVNSFIRLFSKPFPHQGILFFYRLTYSNLFV